MHINRRGVVLMPLRDTKNNRKPLWAQDGAHSRATGQRAPYSDAECQAFQVRYHGILGVQHQALTCWAHS